MKYTVFGKEVEFTDREMSVFNDIGLELSTSYLELILANNDISTLENMDEVERHNICIESIKRYADLVDSTIKYIKRENLI